MPNYISSPAISASTNKVLVGAVAAPGGSVGPATVWAFDKSSGALSWRFDRTVGDFFSSPAIDEAGGRVIIASAHSDIEPNNPSQLYCLNLTNGQLLHTYTFANSGVRTTPTIAGGKVFFPYSPTGQNKIYCFDEDLNLLWSHSGTVSQRMGAIAVSNGYIYTGHDCLDATNGNLVWHISYSEGGGVDFCSPAVADDKMYIENGIGFCCYNANNGALIWNYTNALGIKYGTPSISNGKAFFTSNRQRGLWAFEKGIPTYDVTIKAHCDKDGIDIGVRITMDDVETIFDTPHTFTGLTGTHTFRVPDKDLSGHPFKNWNSGQTTPTITVSSGGTYTAHYMLHNIVLYKCEPEKTSAGLDDVVPIDIGIKNDGSEIEKANVQVWVAGHQIGLIAEVNLQAGETKEFTGLNAYWWWTKGYKEGNYQIGAYAPPVSGETQTSDNTKLSSKPVTLENRCGYAIIVEGGPGTEPSSLEAFNFDVNRAHNTLKSVGFTDDRIKLLEYPTSSEAIRSAIETWAVARVNEFQPLLLFIVAHGGYNVFGDDVFLVTGQSPDLGGDFVSSTALQCWLHNVRTKTKAPIHVILEPCYSGSFLDELNVDDNLTITSCRWDEESHSYKWVNLQTGETWFTSFSTSFWGTVSEGNPVNRAFERACWDVGKWAEQWNAAHGTNYKQTPLLDDNHNGIGDTGRLPKVAGGDGWYANGLHIGHCEWLFPWISSTVATQCYAWPPPDAVTLWAKVENDTGVRNVVAMMIPPDFFPPNGTYVIELECFVMTDSKNDGNYTLTIPIASFTNHASGPSSFRFVIMVQQEDNMTSYPSFSDVVFTADGQPPPDTNSPSLYVTRPLDGDVVHGTISINGTTGDDMSLQKAELYLDSNLIQTINLPRTSESFFQFTLNTASLSNGANTVMVKSYDTSGNYANQTLAIYVINNVHDVAVTNVDSKSVAGQGFNLTVPVTVVNHGSYAESTNVTFCVNSTIIETKTLTNLPVDGVVTVTFKWNTTGFAKGNYTIWAYAWPVQGETHTADNTFTDGWVIVSMVGDVTGPDGWPDGKCDMRDVRAVAKLFGVNYPDPRYNPNYDINDDKKIDMKDIRLVAKQFGKTDP